MVEPLRGAKPAPVLAPAKPAAPTATPTAPAKPQVTPAQCQQALTTATTMLNRTVESATPQLSAEFSLLYQQFQTHRRSMGQRKSMDNLNVVLRTPGGFDIRMGIAVGNHYTSASTGQSITSTSTYWARRITNHPVSITPDLNNGSLTGAVQTLEDPTCKTQNQQFRQHQIRAINSLEENAVHALPN